MATVEELELENAALRAQLDLSMRRQEGLAKNVNDGLLEIRGLRAENERLKAELEGYKVALAERLEEIVRLKQDLEAEQLNVWPASPRQSKEELRAEVEGLKKYADLANARVDDLEAENEHLRGELIAWKHSAVSADAQETEIADLTAQVTALEQERNDLAKKFVDMETYAKFKEEQLAAMTQERNELTEELKEFNEKYWEDHKYTDIKKIDDLQQQLAASEQRGDMLERELASLKAGVGWPHTGGQP